MNYGVKMLASGLLVLLSPFIAHAGAYSLDPTSSFSDSSGTTSLSGTFSLNFSLGLPFPGSEMYRFDSMALTENNTSISLTGNNSTFFPEVLWGVDIQLDAQNAISSLNPVYLGINQTDLGTDYYQYQEQILEPVAPLDSAFNNVAVGNDLFPSRLLLTYELHDVVQTARLATYPSGVIGPAWQVSTLSDVNLGTLTIIANTNSIPEPATPWLMVGFGFFSFRGIKRQTSKKIAYIN